MEMECVVMDSLFNKLWYIKKENNLRFWKCLSILHSLLKIHKFHLISWCGNYPHTDILNRYFGVYRKFLTTKLGEISISEAEIGNHIVLIAEMRFGLNYLKISKWFDCSILIWGVSSQVTLDLWFWKYPESSCKIAQYMINLFRKSYQYCRDDFIFLILT